MLVKRLFILFLFSFLVSACDDSDNPTGPSNPDPTPSYDVIAKDVSDAFNLDPTKEDTDGDGLTDVFEITYGYPTLKPDVADTDGNGISDADEDSDGDTINNLTEQKNGTDPLAQDTDGDSLSDADEITHKTDAQKEDTDGDGMLDGREVQNGTNPLVADSEVIISSTEKKLVKNIDTGQLEEITVKITGEGDLASKVTIFNGSDAPIQGQVGRRFDINLPKEDVGKMQSVEITLPFDPNHANASDPTQLAIYTIDPNTGFWEKLNSVVDFGASTVTATTNHFSPFVISNDEILRYISTIPETCRPVDDPNQLPADVMLVIDSSGSMSSNDPDDLRITASKSFASAMKATDRVGVVDFDNRAKLVAQLTNDIVTINNALDTIDSSGLTDIGAGVQTAISELTNNSDSSKVRAIILLTDGSGSYSSSLTTTMADEGIRAFTIGLTGAVNESLLQEIAEKTRGGYKKIDSADDLVDVFSDFSTVFGDDGKDDDNDGLTNCQEIQGVYLLNNSSIAQTDPNNPDTDGDGILDGTEVGIPEEAITAAGLSLWFSDAYSDPNHADWDGDGLSDSDEYRASTNPFAKDTDTDGLNDGYEILVEFSDPANPDTDGDGLSDGDEVDRRDNKGEGFDPTVYNYKTDWKTKALFTGQFLKGAVFSDIADIDEPPELYGQIVGGFFLISDITGFIGNMWKGEYLDATLSGAALFPVVGDAAGAGARISKFVEKSPHLRYEVIAMLNRLFDDVNWVKKYLPALPAKVGSWAKNPFVRGKELEVKIAADLPGDALLGNFPKIDVWDASKGKVTSIKTLDLDAKSYQRTSAFKKKMQKYADDLNDFEGTSDAGWAGTVIKENAISSRELVVGIPKSLSDDFAKAAKEVANEKGISIVFKVVE